jgi:hypothetical protein
MAEDNRPKLQSIPFSHNLAHISLNLSANDKFVEGLGLHFEHWIGMPSPLGLKDKGDLRRPEGLDVESSNGMIYKKAGCFQGAITSNSKKKAPMDGGLMDNSTAYLTLPRFYENEPNRRMHFSPGDKVYLKNKSVDTKVVGTSEIIFDPIRDNRARFPILCVQMIIDSLGRTYEEGTDFSITPEGNLKWTGNNPGIDPDTGRGRIYTIRYLYEGFWYCTSLPHELRITKVIQNGQATEERAPYFIQIVREYIYSQRNNGEQTKPETEDNPARETERPPEDFKTQDYVKVSMSDVSED